MKAKLCLVVVLTVVLSLCSSPGLAKMPEEIWKELSQLSGEERQSFLVSKAKAEGEVVWYTNKSVQSIVALRNEFAKRFPGVKLKFWRASGERVANRLFTEARAGKFYADVISIGNEYFPGLVKADLVGRYKSPEREFFPDIFKDKEGYWTAEAYLIAIMVYNKSLVSGSQAPRTYEDFLKPEWKGDFAIDTDPDRALMGWLKTWGNEKTEKYLQGIVKNKVAVRRGHTLMTQLLCAGEFKAAIELYAFRVVELKHKGCPLEMVFPNPTPGAVSPLSIARRSPHPYGAALLVDHILSEGGQKILVSQGILSPRRGIKLKYPEMDAEKRGVRLLMLRPEDAEKLGEKYMELRGRFLIDRR